MFVVCDVFDVDVVYVVECCVEFYCICDVVGVGFEVVWWWLEYCVFECYVCDYVVVILLWWYVVEDCVFVVYDVDFGWFVDFVFGEYEEICIECLYVYVYV